MGLTIILIGSATLSKSIKRYIDVNTKSVGNSSNLPSNEGVSTKFYFVPFLFWIKKQG